MATPREVIHFEKLRGLHDYPDKAPLGSASDAVNVEFTKSGPSRRSGTVALRNITVGADTLHGKGIWYWRHTDGSRYLVAAYIDGNTRDAYIDVMELDGTLLRSFNLSTSRDGANYFDTEGPPWSAAQFHPGTIPSLTGYNVLVLATEYPVPGGAGGMNANDSMVSLWALQKGGLLGGAFTLYPITPIDRSAIGSAGGGGLIVAGERLNFWGNDGGKWGIPGTVEGDDPGPYFGGSDSGAPVAEAIFAVDRATIAARAIVSYRNRLVTARLGSWGGNQGNETAIQFCNIGDLTIQTQRPGEAWAYQGWPQNNVVYFHEPDPTPITALTVWRDFLVVFKERSLQLCRFTSIQDFTLLQQVIGTGCVAPGAVANVHYSGFDGIFFMATDGVYAWDGKLNYMSGPIERRLRALGGAALQHCIAISNPYKNHVLFQVGQSRPGSASQATQTPTCFVFDYKTGDWSEFQFGGSFDAACLSEDLYGTGSLTPVFLARLPRPGGAGTGLNVVATEAGVGGNDGAFETGGARRWFPSFWTSARFPYGHHQIRRFRHLRLDQEEGAVPTPLTAYWMMDNQDRAAASVAGQSASLPTQAGAPGTFGNLTFGNATFASRGFFSSRVDLFGGPARWMRFGFETPTNGAPDWHVNGAEVDTRRKEGRR